NLVWNPTTGQLKLIDFGLATSISRRNPTVFNLGRLEGTLAYLSPEQTGRMNRSIDYRTDFYSLGVTLYELFTQQLPYVAQDVLELVHCHLARPPIPLTDHNPAIPDPIAAIVLKLLSKNAEDRYQSCQGIQRDLETCLHQWQETGYLSPFPLAQQDSSDLFQIPQKLYGRETEVQLLWEGFARVTAPAQEKSKNREANSVVVSQSHHELMLITGYSGVGKTSLVQELYKPITQRRGYFVSGKFGQYQRDTPYQAFVEAFSSLIAQLLTEPEHQLSQWREKLISVLKPNVQVLLEVLPDLELIVGSQPPVTELPAIEARNRFNQVFQTFVQVFAQPQHPLVIFLDDLQWADSASLQLLQTFLTIGEGSLFLIGAYRENEVSATHSLRYALEEIQKLGIVIHTISLSPLRVHHIQQLLADTLKRSVPEVAALADLVLAKTDGNPFFMNEFLKTLYVEGLLTFNYPHNHWSWEIAQIQQRNITENVVELLANKICSFHPNTQVALQLAACIGAKFTLQTLQIAFSARLENANAQETIAALQEAVREGVLIPLSDLYQPSEENRALLENQLTIEYQFTHDRLQQAAYSLLSESECQTIHLHLGRTLLKQAGERDRDGSVFEILSHLNESKSLLQTISELIELAELNLLASRRARATAAFQSALRYLHMALECLPENPWEQYADLTASLYIEGLELEYLNGNFEQAETLATIALTHTVRPAEQITIYRSLIRKYTLEANYERAIESGKKALQILGMDLPLGDLDDAFTLEVSHIENRLAGREIRSLLEEPDMVAPEQLIITNLLVDLIPTAYIANQALFAVIVARVVHLSLQFGHSPDCSHGYSAYGVLMASLQQKYSLAYEFGKLALGLCERFHNLSLKCRDSMAVGGYLSCWVQPLLNSISILNQGYIAGLESGEIQFAGYILFHKITVLFCAEVDLLNFLNEMTTALQFTQKTKNQFATDGILAFQLIANNLSGQTSHLLNFDSHLLTETQYLTSCQMNGSFHAVCSFQLAKTALLYLYGEFQVALTLSQATQPLLSSIMGEVFVADHAFYHGLILAALYSEVSEAEQATYLEEIRAIQQQIHLLANHCSDTFSHRFLLISAEIARVTGQVLDAMDLYDQAIATARKNHFIRTEALANELAGKFYLAQKREKIAGLYFAEAYYVYSKWGAISKAQDLEKRYPHLLKPIGPGRFISPSQSRSFITTEGTNLESLDLATVMKGSQVLSGELNLQKLLTQLMAIVLENAGAEKGWLLLTRNDNLQIAAMGTVDTVEVFLHPSPPLEESNQIPLPIVQWVVRKQETIVLGNASEETPFANDPYFQ
ncbi:MAG: AAA family ATPase, partial [Leptolyngbyaceae cyanobacterium bins.59]|nr:AAA family ATPase [Leptolyngbyaceae cyanobacterium bins.59]